MKKSTLALTLCLTLVLSLGLSACKQASQNLVILDESLAEEEYGIGFRKGDVLCDQVTAALQVLAADGTLAKISEDWFGNNITTIVPDATALDGIAPEARVFKLGLDDSFPPMGYRDDQNNIVGFDIDLAKAVCTKLGWELKLVPIDWDAKEMELNSGNIDCIWNGMTLTDERKAAMSCTPAYMENKQCIVVKESSGFKTLADLAGKKLALQAGSSAEDALNAAADFKASLASANTFRDNMTCFMDLKQGSSDAVLVDSIVAGWYIKTGKAQ